MEDRVMISPKFDVYKLTKPVSTETYIDIYEDRINGWIIEPAKILTHYEHGGYAICYLLASYFESYSIYINGKDSRNNSKEFFSQGLFSVFPFLEEVGYSADQKKEIIDIMYYGFRCGLYHAGFTREKIMLVNSENPITIFTNSEMKIDSFQIDTSRLLSTIEKHNNSYIDKLRKSSNKELRDSFLKAIKLLYY